MLELIGLNLAPAVVGSATVARRFLAARGRWGDVNISSSHQARRAGPGATVPVDGGRSVLARDPEARPTA